jgi:hypothetical protein
VTTLTQQLDVVVGMYYEQAIAAAKAEAEHKQQRAKRMLTARHQGEAKSATEAECIAEADDTVADLYSKRLISSAIADSTKQKILSLREQIGMARTEMANQRAMDDFHARDRSIP